MNEVRGGIASVWTKTKQESLYLNDEERKRQPEKANWYLNKRDLKQDHFWCHKQPDRYKRKNYTRSTY